MVLMAAIIGPPHTASAASRMFGCCNVVVGRRRSGDLFWVSLALMASADGADGTPRLAFLALSRSRCAARHLRITCRSGHANVPAPEFWHKVRDTETLLL